VVGGTSRGPWSEKLQTLDSRILLLTSPTLVIRDFYNQQEALSFFAATLNPLHLPRSHTMSVAASRCAAQSITRSLRSPISTSSPLRSAIPQSPYHSSRLSIASSTHFSSRRPFSSSSSLLHGHLDAPKPGEERKVTFVDKDGDEYTFEVADGDNLLDIGVSTEP
jgi:hypothetical protein